ncbi:MAG: GNAT family N-acetyltransferase [Clostridium sp.]|uniref:GNAT family N-acetyltransferase n=1 Tax=Clostridium sp. TaxID=1506 RepID=UPI00304A8207
MNIRFYTNKLTADEFNGLRESVGWGGILKIQVEKALECDLYDVVAMDDDAIVGMGRLVGDGSMYWYIQDVIVLPTYQGNGIGKTIVKMLNDYVYSNTIENTTTTVALMAAKGKEDFYKKFEFIERPTEVLGAGMIRKIRK